MFAGFARLPSANRSLLLEALALLWLVRVSLWALPYRWVQRLPTLVGQLALWRLRAAGPRNSRSLPEAVGWAILTAARFTPGASCLTQALAAQALLGRRGAPSRLELGVTLEASRRLLAHAWLECEGRVIVGGVESPGRYRRLLGVGRR
jgi:transglutaminase superfamily protein